MEETQEKKSYEFAFLISKENFAQELERILKQRNIGVGGAVRPRKINLAYEINKLNQAYFVSFQAEAFPADAKALEGDSKALPEVLRFMIMRLPKRANPPAYHREEFSVRRPKVFTKRELPARELPKRETALSNEELEKKIEEILQ